MAVDVKLEGVRGDAKMRKVEKINNNNFTYGPAPRTTRPVSRASISPDQQVQRISFSCHPSFWEFDLHQFAFPRASLLSSTSCGLLIILSSQYEGSDGFRSGQLGAPARGDFLELEKGAKRFPG